MENLNETITNITYSISQTKLTIIYSNSSVEELILNATTYIAIFNKWFIETPVFITDKYKAIIKALNFIKIGKTVEKSKNELDTFFSNTANALKFFNYARNRKTLIETEKLKWTSNVAVST